MTLKSFHRLQITVHPLPVTPVNLVATFPAHVEEFARNFVAVDFFGPKVLGQSRLAGPVGVVMTVGSIPSPASN